MTKEAEAAREVSAGIMPVKEKQRCYFFAELPATSVATRLYTGPQSG